MVSRLRSVRHPVNTEHTKKSGRENGIKKNVHNRQDHGYILHDARRHFVHQVVQSKERQTADVKEQQRRTDPESRLPQQITQPRQMEQFVKIVDTDRHDKNASQQIRVRREYASLEIIDIEYRQYRVNDRDSQHHFPDPGCLDDVVQGEDVEFDLEGREGIHQGGSFAPSLDIVIELPAGDLESQCKQQVWRKQLQVQRGILPEEQVERCQ